MAEEKNTKNDGTKKDKELSTNKEVKRGQEFQDRIELRTQVLDMIKELLDSATEDAFSKLGYKRVQKYAGVYGNGKKYGSGTKENEYQVRLAGKTKDNIEKQIIFGGKSLESEVNIVFKDAVVNIDYKGPEAAVFHGIDEPWTATQKGTKGTSSFMTNMKSSFNTANLKTLKSELSDVFKRIAKKEVGYLCHTKLGTEDKLEKSTTSTVEESFNLKDMKNNVLKNPTLKEMFSAGFAKSSKAKEDNVEPNIPQIKEKNSLPLKDVKHNQKKEDNKKTLFFDDNAKRLEELYSKEQHGKEDAKFLLGHTKDEYTDLVKDKMKEKFGTNNLEELTPVEKKDLFKEIDKQIKEEASKLNEDGAAPAGVTASGPAGSGAGAYLTPNAWKKTGMLKEESISKKIESTPYGKRNNKRPQIDENWNVIPESKETYGVQGSRADLWNTAKGSKSKDGFWSIVKIDPETHPQGMPFTKPGSKEEWNQTTKGDGGKLHRIGVEENTDVKLNLEKKKFFTESENKAQGINKRYLITEKTSEEYQNERWKKLATFKKYESIQENEELQESIEDTASPLIVEEYLNNAPESVIQESESASIASEKCISVEKPGSLYGTEYKFYEKDFLNENKKYILDLNSMVFVPNPNSGKI